MKIFTDISHKPDETWKIFWKEVTWTSFQIICMSFTNQSGNDKA